jgi:hypothetical protein
MEDKRMRDRNEPHTGYAQAQMKPRKEYAKPQYAEKQEASGTSLEPETASTYRRTDMADVKVKVEKGTLIIEIKMQKATPSGSGKTMVVATTSGNITTDAEVDGKKIVLGLNAYYKP